MKQDIMNPYHWLSAAAIFFCCVTSVLPAGAQQKVSVRMMALTEIETEPLFLAVEGDEKWIPVEWSRRQPSAPAVTFTQDGVLPLFSEESDPDAKAGYKVSHRIKVPSGAKEILLFAWMADGKLQLQPVDDDFLGKNHKRWLLINFSGKEIAFRVGEKSKPILLKSKASTLYTINVEENQPASILGQARIRGTEPKLFYSSYFPVKEGRRTIVIFTDDGDKIRTKLIADHFPGEEKPDQ